MLVGRYYELPTINLENDLLASTGRGSQIDVCEKVTLGSAGSSYAQVLCYAAPYPAAMHPANAAIVIGR